MLRYCLIQGNRVAEIVHSKAECFDVHKDLKWVECTDDLVTTEYTYNNDDFIAPVITELSYQELREAAYLDAGLTVQNYIDEMRKERLGQSNDLSNMDAQAESIKTQIPKA